MATSSVASEPVVDRWFVRLKGGDGQPIVKTMSTPQMTKMIEEGTLKPSVKISRHAKVGYRALATFKEFHAVAVGRSTRTGVDKQTSRYHYLYQKIEKNELERSEPEEETVTSAGYWLPIFWNQPPPSAPRFSSATVSGGSSRAWAAIETFTPLRICAIANYDQLAAISRDLPTANSPLPTSIR